MWRCPKCRARVDDTFNVCWQCGTTPDGIEDPSFVTADEADAVDDPMENLDAALDGSLEELAGTPDLPELVEVHMAENTIEAKFIADRLVEQGIPAVADTHDSNLFLGGWKPTMWGYGPKIRVRAEDALRARGWVEAYLKERKQRRLDAD
jgi:hypothetical protein